MQSTPDYHDQERRTDHQNGTGTGLGLGTGTGTGTAQEEAGQKTCCQRASYARLDEGCGGGVYGYCYILLPCRRGGGWTERNGTVVWLD